MLKKALYALSAVVLLTTLMPALALAQKWDMPMAYSDSNFHTQNGKTFAEAVRIATGGKLDIIVHGGGSLFKGSEIKRAVQTNQAPIGERLLSAHQNENILFGYDSVPFLATSYDQSEKLWQAARPKIEEILEKQNLVLLYSVPWPPQNFYFNQAVNSTADTKGLKFRSYNNSTARLAELMGMQSVQIEAAELSQALATGVVETFVSSATTGYDRKVWESLSHYYEVNSWMPRNTVFANKQAWDDLDPQTRNIVKGIAMMAQAAGTTRSQQLADWYVTQLKANGMTVQPAGAQLIGELKSIGAQMTDEWLQKAGTDGRAIVDGFME